MTNLRLKVGAHYFRLECMVMLLTVAIPVINFGNFYGYYAKLAAVIALLFLMIIMRVADRNFFKIPIVFKLLLLYLFISMFLLNFPNSIEFFLLILCITLILIYQHNDKTYGTVFKIFTFIGLFYSITVYWQWLSPNTFNSVLNNIVADSVYRQALEGPLHGDFPGFACESNRAGLCIAPAAAYAFSHFFYKQRIQTKIKYMIIFGITYGSFWLIGRRAYILFFPICLLGITLYILFQKKSIYSKLAGILIIVVGIAVTYYILLDKIILLLSNNGTTIDLSNREAYWALAFRMFEQNPWFGTGMRSYDIFYQNMTNRDLVFAGAHNCYLQILAEIGIVGVVLFFSAIFYIYFLSLKSVYFSVKNRYEQDLAIYIITTLIIQSLFLMMALSESVFIAPYSCVLFFILANITLNFTKKCTIDKGGRKLN